MADTLERAKAKAAKGEPLNKKEQAALARAREAAVRQALKAIPPTLFNEIFAIQNLQRYQWEETLGIPCGRGQDTIDFFAVGAVIKKHLSRRKELAEETPDMAAKKLEKLEQEIVKLKQQNFKQQTENDILARQRLPKKEITAPLERLAGIIRRVGEVMARKTRLTGMEAQQMINHAIGQYERELANLDTDAD